MKSLILIVVVLFISETYSYVVSTQNQDHNPLYLTPYIESGQLEKGRQAAKIHLNGAKNVTQYSGLITVNKKYNSNIFFWYFEAEENSETAPLLLWLNGGPGSSSLLGLFQQHGPFFVTDDLTLQFRQYYWCKNHHVIYIESPVGTGFSSTGNDEGYSTNNQEIGENLHETLAQFLELFPNLKQNDFYLTGESYSGKYLPALSSVVLSKGVIKNVKGVAIGNGMTDPVTQFVGIGDFLYQAGFIDDHQLAVFREKETLCSEGIQQEDWDTAIEICPQLNDFSNPNSLYANYTGYKNVYNILEDEVPPSNRKNQEDFLNLPSTRHAIHVGNLPRILNGSNIRDHLGVTLLQSEIHNVEKMLANNFRVLIYSGSLDAQVPYVPTINYLKKVNFSHADEYRNTAEREIWRVDGHVAGYVKAAGNLTQVMVIGAGHMVPEDQPKNGFDLITKFSHNEPLV